MIASITSSAILIQIERGGLLVVRRDEDTVFLARQAAKRGGQIERADLQDSDLAAIAAPVDRAEEVCALDQALTRLASLDPRRAQVIELRFFGGLTVDETAQVLGLSPLTVKRDWKTARTWLARELQGA